MQLAEFDHDHPSHNHGGQHEADLDHGCDGSSNVYFFDNSRVPDSKCVSFGWPRSQPIKPIPTLSEIELTRLKPPHPRQRIFSLLQNLLI